MQPDTAANDRGQYGDANASRKSLGVGGIVFVLGVSIGIYALSPGARHWYKHGHLPPVRQ